METEDQSLSAINTVNEIYCAVIAGESPQCGKFYCTTCGGIACRVKEHLKLLPRATLVNAMKLPSAWFITDQDFAPYNYHSLHTHFPKPSDITPKVEYLLAIWHILEPAEKEDVLNEWVTIHHTWTDWLFDGISYHFIPAAGFTKQWVPKLQARSDFTSNPALLDTLKYRYNILGEDHS